MTIKPVHNLIKAESAPSDSPSPNKKNKITHHTSDSTLSCIQKTDEITIKPVNKSKKSEIAPSDSPSPTSSPGRKRKITYPNDSTVSTFTSIQKTVASSLHPMEKKTLELIQRTTAHSFFQKK